MTRPSDLCHEWGVSSPESLYTVLAGLLPRVPPQALREALPLWGALELRDNAVLWKQGRTADSLVIVVEGGLDIVVDGTVITTIQAGEMGGETAFFAQSGVRFAGMSARGRTLVLQISSASLRHLRASASPVYHALLDLAIAGTSARAQKLNRHVAQVRKGNFAAPAAPPPTGALRRLWRRMTRPPANPGPCPPLAEVLAAHPVLVQSTAAARDELLGVFTPKSFRVGDLLVRQGDVDSRVFVIAAGMADILRAIEEHGGALLLGRLGSGAIIGINAFAGASARAASIIATTDGWCYAMTREAFERVSRDAHVAWLEVTLSEFTQQYHSAARALQTAIGVFASQHYDLMASRVEPGDPPSAPKKARKSRD